MAIRSFEDKKLIKQLCESLAFHLVQTEIQAKLADAEGKQHLGQEVVAAKNLIKSAGYDIDELYPKECRPAVELCDELF